MNPNFRSQGIIAPVTLSSAENSDWIMPKIQANEATLQGYPNPLQQQSHSHSDPALDRDSL